MAPDSKSKKRWDRENVVAATIKFFRKTDKDIIDFLEGKTKSTEIKKALRYYMLHHPEEWKGHPLHDALTEEQEPKGE